MNEEVFVGEGRALNKAILEGIEVAVCQPADVAEELAEMEGRVDVEEIAEEDDNIGCVGKVEHIEEEPSGEEPLHDH